MLVGAISISSFFCFWKLDYFSDMNCLRNPLSDMISCSSSTQLVTSDIDPAYINWALTPFQLEKFQLKVSQYVCYIIWESHCTKIIVARLLKLLQGLYKDLDQLKSSFFRQCSYSKLLKKLTQAPTMVEGLQFHSSTQ